MHKSIPLSFLLSIFFVVIGFYIAFGVFHLEINLLTLLLVTVMVFGLGIGIGVLGTKSV